MRHSARLRPLYQKLKGKGKPPKVVLVACAHKLLTILNAVTKQQTDWREPEPEPAEESTETK
ncbi:MAG: hypothetical protein ACR2PL_04070 [Dehalococcoidia bacterium]